MTADEDWFLRGGKRPDAANAHGDPDGWDPPEENGPGETCQNCGAALTGGCPTDEYCGADDGGETPAARKLFQVAVVRVKSVEQTHSIEIEAEDESEAIDIANRMLDNGAGDGWDWQPDEDTAEYDDPWAYEAIPLS